ncbi:MAG TPA: toll/interleukin-1 receptor domain-containing protein [Mycobacteriales bacterium]|nr:toll/interleukin-1 receptor domain-containing protein [Mycobacteriales bacterium]
MAQAPAPEQPSAERGSPPGGMSSADVFISHVEEDSRVARQIGEALNAVGYSTWLYETDAVPGPSYLLQTANAIEGSRAVIVLISADSLGSNQVTAEVVRAHEATRPFLPVLIGISHAEFASRQPEWREAIGAATTIAMPGRGISEVLPRIVDGLEALGVEATGQKVLRHAAAAPPAAPPSVRAVTRRFSGRQKLFVVIATVVLVLAAVIGFVATRGGGGAAPSSTPTAPASAAIEAPTSGATEPTASADARNTPLQTLQGAARVTAARLVSQDCPPGELPGECKTAPAGSRFLALDIFPWGGGDFVFNESLSMSAFSSYVSFDGQRATPVRTWTLEGKPSGFRVVYAMVPASADGKVAILSWDNNPALKIHPRS